MTLIINSKDYELPSLKTVIEINMVDLGNKSNVECLSTVFLVYK
jgi:hypothetical protein